MVIIKYWKQDKNNSEVMKLRRELDGISDKRDEQYKLAREAWDNLKNELIKAVKIYEMVNWLERNLRKIKWLR